MRVGAIPETLLERVATFAGLAPTPVVDTLHAVIVARAVVDGMAAAVRDMKALMTAARHGLATGG